MRVLAAWSPTGDKQVLVMKVKEKAAFMAQAKEAMPLIPGVRSCMKNRPWVVLMLSGTTLSLLNEIVSMFQYLIQYQFHVRGSCKQLVLQLLWLVHVQVGFLTLPLCCVLQLLMKPPFGTVQMKVKTGMAILMVACAWHRRPYRVVHGVFLCWHVLLSHHCVGGFSLRCRYLYTAAGCPACLLPHPPIWKARGLEVWRSVDRDLRHQRLLSVRCRHLRVRWSRGSLFCRTGAVQRLLQHFYKRHDVRWCPLVSFGIRWRPELGLSLFMC